MINYLQSKKEKVFQFAQHPAWQTCAERPGTQDAGYTAGLTLRVPVPPELGASAVQPACPQMCEPSAPPPNCQTKE